MLLLCDVIIGFMFGMHEQLNFGVCLLKILCSGWIQTTKANLWRSTGNVIEWFKTIPDKDQHAFITFDVCDFYPFISEELLIKALDYVSKLTTVTQEDRQIIIHAKDRSCITKTPQGHKGTVTTCLT